MARYDQDMIDYPFDKVHNYSIEFDSVQQMSREFLKLKVGELDKVDAIGEGRSETIAAGALVVRTLMKRLSFKRLMVSTHGLRDGILVEFLEGGVRSRNGTSQRGDVERLLSRPDQPAGLADDGVALLECLVRNGLFDEREKRIVQIGVWRARTPDCVESDADAVFGILMTEDLPMSHRDQLLMALSVVKARRSRTANWLTRRHGSMLSHDAKLVKRLGACVKLMEILDRSRAQYRVAYSGGLRISVIASKGPFPLELSRMAALAFASAIKRPVTIFVSAKERERHVGLVKVGS
jgi:exopolyphosphatase/guanosine-5'-triphosphate,3'-diphosphate pyrophosphatase